MKGGWKLIGADDLWLERRGVSAVQFTVLVSARHGVLQLVHQTSGRVLRSNTSHFTLSDVRRRRLRYLHDDSESQHDQFLFSARLITRPAGID